ncbi:hypothetical protein [Gynuella sp.]|uniref:hypothetical protein n=1 Tax=Gynuella sp. TaxID=2969146 RepID=UPI003D096D96
MNPNISIKYAVYGGSTGTSQARDITALLQKRINKGELNITFDNNTFGDTAPGQHKGFAVIADINEQSFVYAGIEGDHVDFSKPPVNGYAHRNLRINDITATYDPGNNHLFSHCQLDIENLAAEDFPNPHAPSAWVWLDFYLVADDDPIQTTDQFIKIGALPVAIKPVLNHSHSQSVSISSPDTYDMAGFLLSSPNLVPVGDYFLYIQVRNDDNTITTATGAFSSESYSYILNDY